MKLVIITLCGALIACQDESTTAKDKDETSTHKNQRYELALDEYEDGILKLQLVNPASLVDSSTAYGSVEDDQIKLEYATSEKPTINGAYLLYLTMKETGQVIEIALPVSK
jgi:hypothetical protein